MAKRMFLVSEDELRNVSHQEAPPSTSHMDKFARELQKANIAAQSYVLDPSLNKKDALRAVADANERYRNYLSQLYAMMAPPPAMKAATPPRDSPDRPLSSVSSNQTYASALNSPEPEDAPVPAPPTPVLPVTANPQIIQPINEIQRPRANRILEFMQDKQMHINANMEPVFNGRPVRGANVTDILAWMTATANPGRGPQPDGLTEFLRHMKDLNAPEAFISNNQRKTFYKNVNLKMHDPSGGKTPSRSAQKRHVKVPWAS